MERIDLRFPQGMFAEVRARLLEDLGQEHFALLFGQAEELEDHLIIKITDVRYPGSDDYESRGPAHLRLRREYIYDCLVEMQQRGDVNTIIDVHTHPFAIQGAAFSGIDDRDEMAFSEWLDETLEGIYYASIVLSQSDYSARLWSVQDGRPTPYPARIRTQTVLEECPCADEMELDEMDDELSSSALDLERGFLARSVLALGLETLRRIVRDQCVAVVGVGGLGSAIAEHLVHSGFHCLHLIDPDRLETTNLNRIVGATARDAAEGRLKVEAVAEHLQRINPQATIHIHPYSIDDERLLPAIAESDWIMLSTDNHASRYTAQTLALRFGVPLISAGVNITVDEGEISDLSGEVILARFGDRLCLNCLGRLNPTKIAAQTVDGLGEVLEQRGYVTGQAVKEPAVKTLNAMIAALAVETLINQYTGRPTVPILVYEGHGIPRLFPDEESVKYRRKDCFYCA